MQPKAPITPYDPANRIIRLLAERIPAILGENLMGLYLFGSLTYGDFHPDSSDIDLIAVLHKRATPDQLDALEKMHREIEAAHPQWKQRLETSYTPIDLFSNTLPPEQPRPYFGNSKFWREATYGNEWIINNHLLHRYGITILGPEVRTWLNEADAREVQKASIRDYFREWEPAINQPEWVGDPHNQAYLILNLCRILYTVANGEAASKTVSAEWAGQAHGKWVDLIQEARCWVFGKGMDRMEDAIAFTRFAGQEIKQSPAFLSMEDRAGR